MPAYDFICHACKEVVEVRRPAVRRLAPFNCPKCGSENTRRVFSFLGSTAARSRSEQPRNDAPAPSPRPFRGTTLINCTAEGNGLGDVYVGPGAQVRSIGGRYVSKGVPANVVNEGYFESHGDTIGPNK